VHSPTKDTEAYRGSFPRTTPEVSEWHARSPEVEALEPDLPIVDAHHHLFGSSDDAIHYRLDDLRDDLATGHRVLGTVYIEAYESGWRTSGPESLRPVGEIEEILRLTASPIRSQHGDCAVAAGVVAYADLTLGDGVIEVLEQERDAAKGRLRGVRHRTATDDGTVGRFIKDRPRPHLLMDGAFRRGFAHLDRFGLSFDAWIYHTQLGELIDLADAFPNTIIVVDHVGAPIGVAEWSIKRTEVRADWAMNLRALAARPNVRVKIGGMGMMVFGFGFERGERPATAWELAHAWQPYIGLCIDAFGTDRCMFESNFPVDKQSCSYVELWNAFKLATRGLSQDERRDLFYRSACQTYRLPELARIGNAAAGSS
jgi:predicted TIM-barrel fold metal-dependent hydrolase